MIVDATAAVGSILGSLVTSYLVLAIGNIYLLLLAATINVIGYAFTNIVIKESLVGALEVSVNATYYSMEIDKIHERNIPPQTFLCKCCQDETICLALLKSYSIS